MKTTRTREHTKRQALTQFPTSTFVPQFEKGGKDRISPLSLEVQSPELKNLADVDAQNDS